MPRCCAASETRACATAASRLQVRGLALPAARRPTRACGPSLSPACRPAGAQRQYLQAAALTSSRLSACQQLEQAAAAAPPFPAMPGACGLTGAGRPVLTHKWCSAGAAFRTQTCLLLRPLMPAARKFPANTTAAALQLFHSSCTWGGGSGGAPGEGGAAQTDAPLLTETYCRQRLAGGSRA